MTVHIRESRPTYSYETHPMYGTNQLNGTSTTIIHEREYKVKLKLQQDIFLGLKYEN